VERPLCAGERVLLIDHKRRRYLVTLAAGGEFHTHSGIVAHDTLIGGPEGRIVRSTRSAAFQVVRPTLADTVLHMPRGAQVIYPKDLGPLLMVADVFPGARVLESGVGSGALSMTLLRAGADVVGYELRADFAARAVKNVVAFLGEDVRERFRVEQRDCYEGIDESDLDRVLLDLPEPWRVVPHAAAALRPGGILVAYTPSIVQATQFRAALEREGFLLAETLEVLLRTWHVEGPSVRPDHRMVAHTGFLSHGRLFRDTARAPVPLAGRAVEGATWGTAALAVAAAAGTPTTAPDAGDASDAVDADRPVSDGEGSEEPEPVGPVAGEAANGGARETP
jgi:tRNA (adenine57-N1/adenine58-N1)-methyltransferase